MALCAISGRMVSPNGDPVRSRLVVFERLPSDVAAKSAGIVVPDPIRVQTDSQGWLYVTLVDGGYIGSIEHRAGVKFVIQVPDAETASLEELLGGEPTPDRPEFTILPSALPSPAVIGENVTLSYGLANNATSFNGVLMQGAVNRTSEIVDNVWSPSVAGAYTWTVTATGPGGSTTAPVASGVVNPPLDIKTAALLYVDTDTPYSGTASEVTGIAAQGTGGYNLVIQGGTGNNVTKTADGFGFGAAKYMRITGISPQAAGGLMALVEFTPAVATGTQQPLNVGAGAFVLRSSNTTAQWASSNGTPTSGNLGTFAAGNRVTIAAEMNADGDFINTRAIDGTIVNTARVIAPFAPTELGIGQTVNGTIHKVVLLAKAAGEQFPISFADFAGGGSSPPEFTSATVVDLDGQSLALGANVSNTTAPNGQTWRSNYTSAAVRSLSGLQRPDGVVVTHVSAPLLQGYNESIAATGVMNATTLSNLPLGQMLAYGLVREGIITNTPMNQFHGAGGQSVLNFNDDPADGDGRTTLYHNRKHYLEQVKSQLGVIPVTLPRFYWQQGEADAAMARGAYQVAFRKTHDQQRALIQSTLVQAQPPRLYMYQTGGYCRKQNDHFMVLDQLDCVREYSGILIGPNWQVPVVDQNVHPGQLQYLYLSELAVWATVEVVAGRNWNLLPPTTPVTRVGDTITIPITVRSDETLTTQPGKYASYGGDPADLGLEVVGGGSITSASVSGGNIVLQVSGTVTAVRHAFQRAAGINYGDPEYQDSNGLCYVAHRSIIRTTLTKSITVAGHAMQLQRWVPSFEVAVA